MAHPTVSVILPTFDRRDLLVRAVHSCLAQTHGVHEVLVCDDGSTDGSEEAVRSIGDARVKWLPGPHAGRPAVPRNRGIAAATGAWLAFLDSDDAWKPEKLAHQIQRSQDNGLKASCTNAAREVPGTAASSPYFDRAFGPQGLMDLLPVNRVICSSVLAEAGIVRKAGGFPEAPELRGIEDYALWLKLSAYTRIDHCPEKLVIYRDAPASSVRATGVSPALQRDRVLSHLRASKEYALFDGGSRRAIDRHLRAARREAGRPLLDWLFLR
jgi:glycosyltransferase involved in cell wall biosynthesis